MSGGFDGRDARRVADLVDAATTHGPSSDEFDRLMTHTCLEYDLAAVLEASMGVLLPVCEFLVDNERLVEMIHATADSMIEEESDLTP